MGPFLERIKMEGFGAFAHKGVGPFKPGLNVVYGPNESGKTTTTKFVEGVLFGWEADRGNRNSYRPANAERAGSLFFTDPNDGTELEVSRRKNSEGLLGSERAVSLFGDIDKETFDTMFLLTGDELRSLRNTTDVTARLLTAGSGTASSPAHALAELQERLARLMSRSASAQGSIVNLRARREELRHAVAQAAEEAERTKSQDKELRELEPQRADLQRRLRQLNEEVDRLSAQAASLESIDERQSELDATFDSLREEESDVLRSIAELRTATPDELAALDDAQDVRIRERLEKFSEERARREHSVEIARENYSASSAEYRAFVETVGLKESVADERHQRHVQIALSAAVPIALLAFGVPTFIYGRVLASLSITMIGIGLVLCSILLAAASLMLLVRPSRKEDLDEMRANDLQWVMLQDEKKLEACQAELARHEAQVGSYLANEGLENAGSSLRHAKALLDEAKEFRGKVRLLRQRRQAVVSQRSAAEERQRSLDAARAAIREDVMALRLSVGLAPEDLSQRSLSAALEGKLEQRDGLQEALEAASHRIGELKSILEHARTLHRFDELKLEAAQVETRLQESMDEFAMLLLARRMLESAIAAWESKSQPEVYAQASRLLSLMTEGAWTTVRLGDDGTIQVVDSLKTVRTPPHLSLGTCQQLYLALRIALLMAADNVGRAVPILADDILVNFDDDRRRAAARALVELARVRQVIVFTCHKEMADLMQDVNPDLNMVRL